MKAGASKRDITNAELIRENPLVHDPLFARVLVLDDGENPVAIISLDMMGGPYFENICDKIKEEFGIAHTLVAASHVHSDAGGQRTEKWAESAGELIYEAVEEAWANRVPASLRAGRASVQVGFNRRLPDENGYVRHAVNGEGTVVPWVNTLQACTEEGRTLAVLFEHAAHPVIAGDGISPDFPGYAVNRIIEQVGNGIVPLFAQGCGANINGYPVIGGVEKAKEAGTKLGDAVLEAMRTSTEIQADKFKVRSTNITLSMELPSMGLWIETRNRLRITDSDDDSPQNKHLERIRESIERGKAPQIPLEINAVMLGSEWLLVTMEHEIFCEYEIWVDAFAPFDHTMVSAYTNGRKTYVGIDRALALGEAGGYEAGAFPRLGANSVRHLHASFVVGIEGIIKEAIASLWTK